MGNLTDKVIRKECKPKESRYEVRDGDGLALRISPAGRKTWILFFDFEGKRSKMNLGNYPDVSLKDARILASDYRKLLRKGINPVATRRQEKTKKAKAVSVKDFAEIFIERGIKAKGNRTWQEYQRNLDYDVLPILGQRKIIDIERADVIELLENIHYGKGGPPTKPRETPAPNQARQVFKIIRRMFNFAIERGIIQHNPCHLVRPLAPEAKKDRVLSDDEIRYLWETLPECTMSEDMVRALKLVLLTAQRPGEVIGAHKSEFSNDWWIIPAERSKNKRAQRVFLTETIKKLFIMHDFSEWLFPSPRVDEDDPSGKPIAKTSISHALLRNLKDDKKKKRPAILKMDLFTPHDLRRTAATNLAKLGFTDEIIGEVLNHTRQGVTSIYNRHSYDLEKQKALEAWDRRLHAILTEKKDNVIPMTRKSKQGGTR